VVSDGDLGRLHPPPGVHREMKDSKRGKEGAVVADGDLGRLHPPPGVHREMKDSKDSKRGKEVM
jgi:hypothetical protein